jgi:putative NADH-flavin reductase
LNYCKVESAIQNKDAVIIALGNNKGNYDNYLTIATKNIIRVMEDKKVKRLICISASGVLGDDGGFFFDKILYPLYFKKIYTEKKRQLQLILRSNLDWIIVRPPQLTNGSSKEKYHITFDKPHRYKISRGDLADFIIKLLSNNEYVRKMPIISN